MKHNIFAGIMLVLLSFLVVSCGGSDNGSPTPSVLDADSDGVADADDNCPNDANATQADSDVDGEGDACDPLPTTYAFTNESDENTVSYTGQTARHILVNDLVDAMSALDRNAANTTTLTDLEFYYSLDAATRDPSYTAVFDLSGGENIIGNDTDAAATTIAPGAVSSGKVVKSKIAGEDSASHILGAGFFGWGSVATPADLMDEFLSLLDAESRDITDSIAVAGGTANIGIPTVTEEGLDLRQLIQKFLLGALTFSQGTADYLSIDYGSDANLTLASGRTYTEGAHDFDEAFGYFGAARNYNDLTDAQIRNGYDFAASDSIVVDSAIDVRSEFNFGNSTNCAKRDQGTASNTNPTDYTQEVFDAFLTGRQILQNAAVGATESTPGTLSVEAEAALSTQITIAAQTWEKCIAATVVHYINDVIADMGNFSGDDFADLDNFLDLAKHWGEMKGFALGLQFSPYSPFRTREVMVDGSAQTVSVDIADLQEVLSLMGDAPVLADGSQGGVAPGGTAEAARNAYIVDLESARDILQDAYAFDAENVTGW